MDSLLVLSFHPAFYPPKSGGELRLYNIYRNLSRQFKITLVTFTYPGGRIETIDHAPGFREIRIPKTGISVNLHHLINRLSSVNECSAVVTSIESRLNWDFKRIVQQESAKAKAVIFVSPFLYTIPKKLMEGRKVIYESYNAEYHLMRTSFSGSLLGRLMLWYVKRIEGSLLKDCDAAFAVSEEDRDELYRLYHVPKEKISLSYNGIDVSSHSIMLRAPNPVCIFIGSYHPPNIEAMDHIIQMAADIPGVTFLIVGGVTDSRIGGGKDINTQRLPESVRSLAWRPLSDNVFAIGKVSDEEKIRIFDSAGIGLNPMLSGSGTNIKMLDYMAAGLPIVSTTVGARGLNIMDGEHAVICDIDDFPSKICDVLSDERLYRRLSVEGRRLVEEKYDWKKIADKMAKDLELILR